MHTPRSCSFTVVLITALVFTLSCTGSSALPPEILPYNPVADPQAVIVAGNARFTVLTDRLFRIEYSSKGALRSFSFENQKNQVDRPFCFSPSAALFSRLTGRTNNFLFSFIWRPRNPRCAQPTPSGSQVHPIYFWKCTDDQNIVFTTFLYFEFTFFTLHFICDFLVVAFFFWNVELRKCKSGAIVRNYKGNADISNFFFLFRFLTSPPPCSPSASKFSLSTNSTSFP